MHDYLFDKEYYKLKNPKIPQINMFLRTLHTGKGLTYKYNITDYTSKGKFCIPEKEFSYGDQTV